MTFKSRFFALAVGLRSVAADIIPPHPFPFIAAALAFVMVGSVTAFAQDASAPVVAASFADTLGETFATIARYVEMFFIFVSCVAALLAGGPVINGVISLLGVKDATQRAQLEKLFSDRLHGAVGRSIAYAVAKSGLPLSAITITTILSDAVAYLQDKNPDDIAFFKLEVKQLEDLIAANWPSVFGWLKGSGASGTLSVNLNKGPDVGNGPIVPISDAAVAAGAAGARQALHAFDAGLSERMQAINKAVDPDANITR